eukprot:Skav206993  [mRNA]  locus=scaffold2010:201377:211610:- [translate_table: standard]
MVWLGDPRPVTVNMGMSMPSWFDINSLEPELFNLNPPGLKEGPSETVEAWGGELLKRLFDRVMEEQSQGLQVETCFLIASLGINVGVLSPLSVSIYFNHSWAKAWYGEDSMARSILLSVYMRRDEEMPQVIAVHFLVVFVVF